MGNNQLREFFRKKKKHAEPKNIDWAARRDAWIKAVKEFYPRIENDYLAGVNEISTERRDKLVREDHVGRYRIPELILRFGDERVGFSPKGMTVVGANGRIDVRGDRGEATLIWQGGEDWYFVASRIPTLQLVPLNPDTLAHILQEIMRP